ncbi:interferon-inducible double-stranded RNA-dependent protein kinase activator A isoform X2 [Rattus norvegicus]|uniref:interferon-inducible double-stranded RNA-dependent protein kinase activator A isoform X2 n=1 Tax=Rattus norvegicus TaxID=10116 RepID=UPI002FD83BDE
MRGGAGRSEALEAERGRLQELGRARTGGEGGTRPQEGLRSSGSPIRAQAIAGKDRLGKGAGPGEPGKGRELWQSGAGASGGGAWQGGAGQRGPAERGCGRLFRAEAPPLLPSPPVLLQEGSRQRSEGRPSGSAGTLLSGTGRRGEGGPRFSLLRIAVASRPFSPCPTAGIVPRPRRCSARTAGPSVWAR